LFKQRHQWLFVNAFLFFAALWNLAFWNLAELTIAVVFILFLMNFSIQRRSRLYLKQLQMYEEGAAKIIKTEELSFIPPLVADDGELMGIEFNKLMRVLQKQHTINQSNHQIIRSVSRVIETPLVIINSSGRVDYANDSFKMWHSGKDIRKVRSRTLRRVLQDALLREVPRRQELNMHKKYYIAASNPIQDEDKNIIGIVVLFHDITELKTYQNLQREFFGNASHELKTPISAIKGCTEILLSDEHDQATYTEFLTIIQEENLRLERLVQDLLLINRYENHQIELRKELTLLNRLLTDSIMQVLNFANLKKQKIHLEAVEHIYFHGDYTMLQQCFLNLLTNAIHYSGENSKITIKLGKDPKGNILLTFKDNGVGIPAKDLPHIFERFYRVDKARSRHSGGSGLGLPIVLSIVEAHKGSIEVESKLDQGTTFTITLPNSP